MANVRINALATTATGPASDDFVAFDGTTNGTRKIDATLLAYRNAAQTFTGTQTFAGVIAFSGTSSITSASGQALVLATGTSGTALSIASATNAPTFSVVGGNRASLVTTTGLSGWNLTSTAASINWQIENRGTNNSGELWINGGTTGAEATWLKIAKATGVSTFNGTTDASAGAGSVVLSGGIYVTKKIISGSTLTTLAGVAWDVGAAAVVSPTSPNRTLKVTVAGNDYYIAAKTTND